MLSCLNGHMNAREVQDFIILGGIIVKHLCFCWIPAASLQLLVTSHKPALPSLHFFVKLAGPAATFTPHPGPFQISRALAHSRFISTLNTTKKTANV